MGAGNNLGIKHSTTDFALILNPDVVLENDTIDEMINASKEIESLASTSTCLANESDASCENFSRFSADCSDERKLDLCSIDISREK